MTAHPDATNFKDAVEPAVSNVELDTDRIPPRANVALDHDEMDGDGLPGAVTDGLDYFNARIEDITFTGYGPVLKVALYPRWSDGGTTHIRSHGSSSVATIPPEAMDRSALSVDSELDVHARDGEIHLKQQDQRSDVA